MALSEKDVRGIAEYAKLALTDDELTQMTSYLNDAVQMLEPVLQYDLPDVEPTFHPIGSLSNEMGDDLREPERDLPLAVALENAGSARDRYFRVGKSFTDRCTCENNIWHLTPTQTLCRGFAQCPTQTLCNI